MATFYLFFIVLFILHLDNTSIVFLIWCMYGYSHIKTMSIVIADISLVHTTAHGLCVHNLKLGISFFILSSSASLLWKTRIQLLH